MKYAQFIMKIGMVHGREKVLFSELHTKSEKYWAKNFMYYPYRILLWAISGLSIGLILIVGGLVEGSCNITDPFCGAFIALWVVLAVSAVPVFYRDLIAHAWIKITRAHVLFVVGDGRKVVKKIATKDLEKIVLNMRLRRVELHLAGGRVIKIKRRVDDIKSSFLYFEQNQRFKKAMDEIGVPYEIIWP